jgi:hypothetical protein
VAPVLVENRQNSMDSKSLQLHWLSVWKKPVQMMQLVRWKTMIQHFDLNWVSNADILSNNAQRHVFHCCNAHIVSTSSSV